MTSEVVPSYVACNAVPPSDVPALIATVHATLVNLGRRSRPVAVPEKPTPPVSIRKSVTDDYLISIEDGKRYQVLKRHLTQLGLTPDDYRAKWGLPADYPMTAPAYTRKRSALAKEMGLGALRRKR